MDYAQSDAYQTRYGGGSEESGWQQRKQQYPTSPQERQQVYQYPSSNEQNQPQSLYVPTSYLQETRQPEWPENQQYQETQQWKQPREKPTYYQRQPEFTTSTQFTPTVQQTKYSEGTLSERKPLSGGSSGRGQWKQISSDEKLPKQQQSNQQHKKQEKISLKNE